MASPVVGNSVVEVVTGDPVDILRLPVIIARAVGLLDVEHLHGDGALVGDGTDGASAGDVIAVTVTISLLSDSEEMLDVRVTSLLSWCPHRR